MYLTEDGSSPPLVCVFALPQVGWNPSAQVDIDAYQLNEAKYGETGKIVESQTSLQAWRKAGFTYTGSLPGPATFNLSENSARYADVKSSRRLGGVNKSKFYDIAVPRVQRDFVDDTGFDGFTDGINEEEERIMEKYNEYGEQIEEAATVAEVDAITISYAP